MTAFWIWPSECSDRHSPDERQVAACLDNQMNRQVSAAAIGRVRCAGFHRCASRLLAVQAGSTTRILHAYLCTSLLLTYCKRCRNLLVLRIVLLVCIEYIVRVLQLHSLELYSTVHVFGYSYIYYL